MFEVVNTGLVRSSAPVNGTVKAGNVVYSVQVPRDQVHGGIVEGGIEVQMRQTLTNLTQAVEAAGGSLKDVAQIIIYLTDKSNFQGMNSVYTEFFDQPYPSRATVIADLMGKGCLVEIVAHIHLGSA
jgi:2-iminobutanoate/2-iminopropanoate deaminase